MKVAFNSYWSWISPLLTELFLFQWFLWFPYQEYRCHMENTLLMRVSFFPFSFSMKCDCFRILFQELFKTTLETFSVIPSIGYLLSHLWLLVTLWTVPCQAPLSMAFSRQKYWSGLPCPSTGIELGSLTSTCIGKWVLYH